LLNIKQRDIV